MFVCNFHSVRYENIISCIIVHIAPLYFADLMKSLCYYTVGSDSLAEECGKWNQTVWDQATRWTRENQEI